MVKHLRRLHVVNVTESSEDEDSDDQEEVESDSSCVSVPVVEAPAPPVTTGKSSSVARHTRVLLFPRGRVHVDRNSPSPRVTLRSRSKAHVVTSVSRSRSPK